MSFDDAQHISTNDRSIDMLGSHRVLFCDDRIDEARLGNYFCQCSASLIDQRGIFITQFPSIPLEWVSKDINGWSRTTNPCKFDEPQINFVSCILWSCTHLVGRIQLGRIHPPKSLESVFHIALRDSLPNLLARLE
jgi:hypothetical protein